jgi:hypothetical protein
VSFLDTEIAAIKAETDSLFDWEPVVRLYEKYPDTWVVRMERICKTNPQLVMAYSDYGIFVDKDQALAKAVELVLNGTATRIVE